MELNNKFTILNLNGEAKYVSAIYDGDGNEIIRTYETKEDSTNKNSSVNESISAVQGEVNALEDRMNAVEAFEERIKTNEGNINSCLTDIEKLDGQYTNLNDNLTVVGNNVNTNTETIAELKGKVEDLTELLNTLNETVGYLKAMIENEDLGILALNAHVEQNAADIAALQNRLV